MTVSSSSRQWKLPTDAEVDSVQTGVIGAAVICFRNQGYEPGFADRSSPLGGAEVGDDPSPPQNGEAALGIVGAGSCAARCDQPPNAEFVPPRFTRSSLVSLIIGSTGVASPS